MSKLDSDITEWAEDVVNNLHKSGFSGINIIEKILKDPGISTKGSRHRVLWWPKNKRLYKIGKAMHQVSGIGVICLVIQYGRMLKEDGNIYTAVDLSKDSSIDLRRFEDECRAAKGKLRAILRDYKKGWFFA